MRRFTASRRRYRLQILAEMDHERIAGEKRMAAVGHPHQLHRDAITRAGIKKNSESPAVVERSLRLSASMD
ncbi:hypothetical protein P4S07_005130 [Serratia marcescens]|uniref:hypothetical protein n=1 Tax=Serratia TaxID=613 RepID=UPI002404F6C2|nr:hypothetical protein [Serratia marcescens]MDF9719165.1 hypothetical protein [Serratia marcescens]HBL7016614.1 hypothetical protein [Serratia marcescens]